MRRFNSMPAIEVRPPWAVKKYAPDKPYLISWNYPVWYRNHCSARRRHMVATEQKALEFALKHKIPGDRVPYAMRKKLCEFARTVKALGSTNIVRSGKSSAPSATSSCPGS